jgi:hypothetical protein
MDRILLPIDGDKEAEDEVVVVVVPDVVASKDDPSPSEGSLALETEL